MSRRVQFLVASRHDPSTRFRVDAYRSRFEELGVGFEVHEIPERGRSRNAVFAQAADFDVTVLLRRLLVPRDVKRVRRHATRLVYEFDDAMAFRDSTRGATTNRIRMRKFAAAVRAADLVVAGNRTLARLARDSGGEPIIVPTVVDIARYARTEPRPMRTVPVVGWIGTAANFPYLEAAVPAIARARRQHPFEFTVMAESPPPMRDAIFVPWSEAEEVRFLHELDIGLMPLSDDAWCRGKCGAKALQYMAAEVPVVASAVGDTELIVGPGGRVVRTLDAFGEALAALLADGEERARVGAAGRRHVEKNFQPSRWVGRLVDAYFGSRRER